MTDTDRHHADDAWWAPDPAGAPARPVHLTHAAALALAACAAGVAGLVVSITLGTTLRDAVAGMESASVVTLALGLDLVASVVLALPGLLLGLAALHAGADHAWRVMAWLGIVAGLATVLPLLVAVPAG